MTRKVKETLESGKVVAVIGWRNNHHTPFTRGLPDRKVRFYTNEKPPKKIGSSTGLILCAKYVCHATTDRIKNKDNHDLFYPILLEYRIIKETLKACQDLMVLRPCAPFAGASSGVPKETVQGGGPPLQAVDSKDSGVPESADDEALDFATRPRRKCEMSQMDKFVKSFLSAAAKDKNGCVGRNILSDMRAALGIKESAPKLVKTGWILPEVRKGKSKVGCYKAGPKMLEAGRDEKFEPEDPVERAKHLISQEPDLLTEKTDLTVRLEQVEQRLSRIEKAKGLLGQLEDLMKPKV